MLHKRTLSILVTASMLAPIAASAATPKQILEQAMKETFKDNKALRIDADFTFGLQIKNAKSQTDALDISNYFGLQAPKSNTLETQAKIRFLYRRRDKTPQGLQDSEGQLRLEQVKSIGKEYNEIIESKQPVTIEWKYIGKTLYFRLKTSALPPELTKAIDPEYLKFLGQWMSYEGLSNSNNATTLPLSKDTKSDLQEILITRTSRIPRPNKNVVYRYEAQLNLSYFDAQRKKKIAEYKDIEKKTLDSYNAYLENEKQIDANILSLQGSVEEQKAATQKRTKDLIDAENKRYAQLKETAKKTRFYFIVNTTTKTLEHIDFVIPWQSLDNLASASKNEAKASVSINGGVTFIPNGNWTVEMPRNVLKLEDVIAFVMQREQEKTMPAPASAMTPSSLTMNAGFEFVSPETTNTAQPQNLTQNFTDSDRLKFTINYPLGWKGERGLSSNQDLVLNSWSLQTEKGNLLLIERIPNGKNVYSSLGAYVADQKKTQYATAQLGSISNVIFSDEGPMSYRLTNGTMIEAAQYVETYTNNNEMQSPMKIWTIITTHPKTGDYITIKFIASGDFDADLPTIKKILSTFQFTE